MRILLASFLVTLPFAATAQDAPKPKLPDVATEIVLEDLTLTVKKLRIGVALSPDQIENITKALSSAGAKVEAGEDQAASEEGTSSDD